VVGSRNPTRQGTENGRAFSSHLSQAGWTIVSGLALGIDAAAHTGGLDGPGSTIAVVGTGLDSIYPKQNRELAHRIAAEGLIVSEFPLGTSPRSENFPIRNRIIAGMSSGTLVVEAALQSGSLITARLALEAGRDVFAIPGSIHSPQARGCHALIKQGAKLVDRPKTFSKS
jgi:DNA processing protein